MWSLDNVPLADVHQSWRALLAMWDRVVVGDGQYLLLESELVAARGVAWVDLRVRPSR